ncbi:MAG: MFS transporter [Chloroflexota bacterium]
MKETEATDIASAGQAAPLTPSQEDRFDAGTVLSLSAAHLTNDMYGSFIGVLLPLLIAKHHLTMAAAGALATLPRWPGIAMPFLGYLADRYDSRVFVIWGPTVTALTVSSIGLAPNYVTMVVLLLVYGFATASFHPGAASMATLASGRAWGKGTSYFMTGGELSRTVGPPFIVAVVSIVSLEGAWIAALPAIIVSLINFRRIGGRTSSLAVRPAPAGLLKAVKASRRPLLLLAGVVTFRSLVISAFQIYYATFLTSNGATLLYAGLALAVYEAGGVIGAFAGGPVSDRLGRRSIMVISQALAGPLLFGALVWSQQPLGLAAVFLGGMLALCAGPVQLALAQELLPGNRSVASGITMFLSFEGTIFATLFIGFTADAMGLQGALGWSVLISMLSLPFTLLLPETRSAATAH